MVNRKNVVWQRIWNLKTLINKKHSGTEKDIPGSQCVGSYTASGYTRSDGTKVGDYIRTCGAKHSR